MDVRTGFVTQIGMDDVAAIEWAADVGLDFVELMLDGAGERRRHDAAALRNARASTGLDLLVHLPFGGIDLGSPLEHVRTGSVREIEAALDAAAAIGATKAVVHAESDAWRAAWGADEIRPPLADSLGQLHEHAADAGVELCVENTPGGFVPTAAVPDLLAGVDVDEPIAMTLDTGHARMDGIEGEALVQFASTHADRISHVHLNDTRRPADEHLPFGAGSIDFASMFGALPDDWRGTLSIEVMTTDLDYVGVSADRLHALLDDR